MSGRPKIDVHALSSCIVMPPAETAGDATKKKKDVSAAAILHRLKRRYDEGGSRTVHSVEAVLLCHAHNHPHLLLIRRSLVSQTHASVIPTTASAQPPTASYRLPGGKVRGSENPVDCLFRKLARDLLGFRSDAMSAAAAGGGAGENAPGAEAGSRSGGSGDGSGEGVSSAIHEAAVMHAQQSGLRIGEVLSVWCRPNFDRPMYPYIPAHVNEAKELRTVYLVHLPPEVVLVPSDSSLELVAVPIFDLYENSAKYGALISSIPHVISRFYVNYC